MLYAFLRLENSGAQTLKERYVKQLSRGIWLLMDLANYKIRFTVKVSAYTVRRQRSSSDEVLGLEGFGKGLGEHRSRF